MTLAAENVDLQLLLAVDSSSSVSDAEFDLQMRGFAQAFRDPDVQAAIRGAGDRGVAVAMIHWSGADSQVIAQDWSLLFGADGANSFADSLDQTPRYVERGSTALGSMLDYAGAMLRASPYTGQRQVIDISGDGRANQGKPLAPEREALLTQDVTINGLAILNEDDTLDRYYREQVINGTGAFLITATDYEDFARAIRRKLLRELEGAPLSHRQQRGQGIQLSQGN
ncbi:DUF1194 domain-containing protein [Fodinicurvata halophila]|uniref:DUF1194 domain-containing protein n=2 Tax=Fodinicurvata halophila TaxID=1419723 RepID=A0ABV8UKN1_9PROT